MNVTKPLAIASLAFGVILYLTSVAGLFFDAATSPGDIGLLSTTMVFLLFGALGLVLDRTLEAQAA